MRRDERIHEGFEVWAPPLRKSVTDLPLVVYALACELCADGCKALVQPSLKAFDLVVLGAQIITRADKS